MALVFIFIYIVGFYVSLSIHEAAHALAAHKLGDPTAKLEGRLTLNPLAHIDIFGTVILPIFLVITGLPAFGWAKPVIINPNNFRSPRWGNFLTALSGPTANILFAVLFGLIYKFTSSDIVKYLMEINIVLAVFNLLPIPPLDGSKVWHLVLNNESYYTLERMGPFILIAVIFFAYSFGLSVFGWVDSFTNAILRIL